ncbi:MAG TPA: flagellar filament capping protein FliD [Noviherbaspirillum sp.]|nr:flagellar filament capping protein FliD [Noviherbaspirillum sp.]
MAGISSPGIGSNLDINGIVSKLMQAESQPLLALAKKEASYQAKLSAFGTLSGALSAFQSAVGTLNNQSTFQSMTATASNTDMLTATATAKANAASYSVTATQLAQAQSIAAAGQTSTSATIGTGTAVTLTFQFGTISGGKLENGVYVPDPTAPPAEVNPSFTQDPDKASGTVTIDSTNNSLLGIRDAINSADLGVTASIVSDGSASPYRLVITSNETGETSSMKITVDGADPDKTTLNSLFGYDPAGTQNMTQTAAAQNAEFTVNGVAVTSKTNTITDAIENVSMTLTEVGSSTLSVARNTTSVQANVSAMVKAYNDLNATIKKLTAYNENPAMSGPLIGDSAVRNIEAQIRKLLSSSLTGGNGALTTLTQAGISINKEGVMSLDAAKLSTAMNNNMTDVMALFSSVGKTSDSLVSFVSSTSTSTQGSHSLFVSQLATQGKLVGSLDLSGGILIDNSNKDLTVTIDGVTASVSLVTSVTPYTADEIAAQVQSAINGASGLSSKEIAVNVTVDGSGFLNITSSKFGSESKVTATGTAATALLGAATATDGVDVAGTIGGVAATGSGQFLTAATGSPAAGLKVEITGGAAGVSRGTITFSQGHAFNLKELVDEFLGSDGVISGRRDGINRSIENLTDLQETFNERLADIEARYRKQFTALDVMIGSMSATSQFLTQQLAQLSSMSAE